MRDRWFLFGVVLGFILLLFKTKHIIAQGSSIGSFNASLAPVSPGAGTGSGAGSSSGCCGGKSVSTATGPGPAQANINAPAAQMFYNSVGPLNPYQSSVRNLGLTPGQVQFYNSVRGYPN